MESLHTFAICMFYGNKLKLLVTHFNFLLEVKILNAI